MLKILIVSIMMFMNSFLGVMNTSAKGVKKKLYNCTRYANFFENRKTANGEVFHHKNLTCATSNKKYLGKHITVYCNETGRKLKLKVNDLMAPRIKFTKVAFDLTNEAMKRLSGRQNSLPGNIYVEIVSID